MKSGVLADLVQGGEITEATLAAEEPLRSASISRRRNGSIAIYQWSYLLRSYRHCGRSGNVEAGYVRTGAGYGAELRNEFCLAVTAIFNHRISRFVAR